MAAQWVGGLVGLGVVGALTAFLSWNATHPQPVPELALQPEACDPAPEFTVKDDPYDTIRKTERGWDWLSQGYIQMHPCTGGTLTISGYGVEAGGDWPLLMASLDTELLGSWKFDQPRSLTVKVPHGGRVILAFQNSYYNAEKRPIQRRDLRLQVVRWTPAP